MIIKKYENIQIWKYANIHVENINVKNVKEYVKKVNVCTKNYKVTSNRNVNKETNNQTKKKYIKATNIYKCV